MPEHSAAGVHSEEQGLQRAVEITVQVSLQEGRPQDLGLWAQQGGPEHVTREAFLRHLWASGGHIPSGRRLRDNC